MAYPKDRQTLRPKQYPELEAERARAKGKRRGEAQAARELEPAENLAEKPVEQTGRKLSGSYRYSGRKITSDRIPAAIVQGADQPLEARKRPGSGKVPVASHLVEEPLVSRNRASSGKIPATTAESAGPAAEARRSASSAKLPVNDNLSEEPFASRRRASSTKIPATISQSATPAADARRSASSAKLPVNDNRSEEPFASRGRVSSVKIPAASLQKPGRSDSPRQRVSSTRIPAVSDKPAESSGDPISASQDRIKDGLTHLAHKRFDLALTALRKALELDPRNEEAGRWLLVCQARKLNSEGKREEAVKVYQELLKKDQDHYEAAREVSGFEKEKKLKGVPFGRYFAKKSRGED